jgi:hypothetical protein
MILSSAMSRYPFQSRHLPFPDPRGFGNREPLLTHPEPLPQSSLILTYKLDQVLGGRL